MKSARWLVFSLALNLVLGVSLFGLARRMPLASSHLSSREITNRNIRVATRAPVAGHDAGAKTIEINEPFNWSQLESEDYRVYTANLRRIGCPEATVRDIVVADVRELFRQRLRELVEPVVSRFWELIGNKEEMETMVKEKEQQLDSLAAERRSLLEEVLGEGLADHDSAVERASVERREVRRAALSFLPEAKKARCLEVEEKFAQLREAASRQPRGTPQENQAELKRLHEEEQAELSRALSFEELAEYKLRNSRFVDSVVGLPGFEAGEDELKEIVRLKEELARTAELKERNVDLRITQRAQAEKEMQESLKTRLGPERFAEYQRAQDGRYQEIYQLVSRFDLPEPVAADVYGVQREAQAQAARLLADKMIADDQRQQLLQAIRAETERSLSGTLGPKPFEVYQSRYGQWLADLGPKAAAPK